MITLKTMLCKKNGGKIQTALREYFLLLDDIKSLMYILILEATSTNKFT